MAGNLKVTIVLRKAEKYRKLVNYELYYNAEFKMKFMCTAPSHHLTSVLKYA